TTSAPNNTTCPANEEFKECGTACEPSCRNPKPEICTEQCVRGCQCKSGFYRNDENVCVSNCSGGGGCGVNEERKQCGTACEPTCSQPNPTTALYPRFEECLSFQWPVAPQPLHDSISDPVRPCSELNCPRGTRCELGRVICPFVPPCFTQQTRCVPAGPDSYRTSPAGPRCFAHWQTSLL
ncbi:trypsin Inhibitor like cysteine rich domain protein, partial [Ostertagia ostertagi]